MLETINVIQPVLLSVLVFLLVKGFPALARWQMA